MSTAVADLELTVRRMGDAHTVELRFTLPDSDAEVRPASGTARFDLPALRALARAPDAYGRALTKALFDDGRVHSAFTAMRAAAEAQGADLRVHLAVDASAPELHLLRWETLRDPDRDAPLATSERTLLSRYLASADWRPVKARALADLRALVVIANPAGLPADLPAIDAPAELAGVQRALGDGPDSPAASNPIAVTPLAGPATIDAITAELRNGYDILYLVCHGALVDGQSLLYLADASGHAVPAAGDDLVRRIGDLGTPPRLVVLASCQSAQMTLDDEGALAALGPRLAESGVPAVVAMQGNVSMDSMAAFMPVFFSELRRDGLLDRALAAARGAVRDRADWWMPALFMRLKSGRLWYVPGLAVGANQSMDERWEALLARIGEGRCTPLLGPGLHESLFGSTRDIARRWAEQYHFPLEPHAREDLPQVAQYLATSKSDAEFPARKLSETIRAELWSRFGARLPATPTMPSLDELLTAVGALRRREIETEPHRLLAALPFPVYLTTNPDHMLADALGEVDPARAPQVRSCRWRDEHDPEDPLFAKALVYPPSREHPLVYHLFGQMQAPDSLVLTEDDYFDYLIGVTRHAADIPNRVLSALTNTALVFVGFRLDDWIFRVLFRSIAALEGGAGRHARFPHVAVQVDPEESRLLEPDRARRYLESYFGHESITIYWGSAEDFTADLYGRWLRAQLPAPAPAGDRIVTDDQWVSIDGTRLARRRAGPPEGRPREPGPQ
ncbi:MAG: CHAT domain-containing protein [Chloroflexi bacterium]|nr:CHAT domain-containing protein [Chloroflexota bacterium]